MFKFDYTWRCDCDEEGTEFTLNEARRKARNHLKIHNDKTPNWSVFIDQYSNKDGELSGRYWKIIKNH